jgi:hypothetical protein
MSANFDASFEHYARAGKSQKELTPWTDAALRRLLATFERELTPAVYRSLCRAGFPSKKAIFVVGMPRSGTSLIEQIIASHPQAYGAGEIKAADAVVDGLRIGKAIFTATDPDARSGANPDRIFVPLHERGRCYIESLEAIAGCAANCRQEAWKSCLARAVECRRPR